MQKPTAAQRKAQSEKDKAIARGAVSNFSKAELRLMARPLPPRPMLSQPRMIRVMRKNNPDQGFGGPTSPNFPRVQNAGAGGPLSEDITFDEYIGEINGSVAFTATKFPLQPGIAGTFPKGAIKAALYSEWRQISCEFYYKPEVSGFATQGQGGKVILAMDYNAGNPAPTTKQQVEIMHRVDNMPYEKMALRTDSVAVNRADAKYIRTGPIPVDEDIKTFDGGNLWVCTIGQANANVVGELHVRYKFRCSKPTLLNPAQGGLISNVTLAQFSSTTIENAGATGVATKLLAATAITNGLGVVNTTGSFVPPAGNYLVDARVYFQDASAANMQCVVDIQKNAVSVYPAAGVRPVGNAESDATGTTFLGNMSAQVFVSCNGVDAVTVPITMTYAAGVWKQWGTVTFQAL